MAAVFLLFTPVSITTLIGTEDARFILNGISPIAKGDLKWRDALLVTGTVNSNAVFSTLHNRHFHFDSFRGKMITSHLLQKYRRKQ